MKNTKRFIDFFGAGFLISFLVALAILLLSNDDDLARTWTCETLHLCFRSKNPEFWNSIGNSISTGTLLSLLFYWILVRWPEIRRRRRVVRNFLSQYAAFKSGCIDTFLVLSRSPSNTELIRELHDPTRFRAYFKEPVGNGQNRWHAFLNGLNDYYIEAIARRMENFRDEIHLLVQTIDIQDEEAAEYLSYLSTTTFFRITRSDDYDEVKSLSGYFWNTFAGWNFVEGYRDDDPLLTFLDRI
jgi:hypothetical protein